MTPIKSRWPWLAASAISAVAISAAGVVVSAQEVSPAASEGTAGQAESQAAGMSEAHPLHIHDGTCDQLGDVIFPLGEISPDLKVDGEPATGDQVGSVTDQDFSLNVTTVAATLDELTSSDHAVNIHRSAEAIQEYIACGDIGGTKIHDDALVIRLNPLNDSGYAGFALFREDGDGNTTVYSMLAETDGGTSMSAEPSMEPGVLSSEQPSMEPGVLPSEQPSMEPDTATAEEAPAASGDPDVVVEVTVDDGDDVDVDVQGADESPAA